MAELTSSPKAHTITWPFSPKTAEDIDYNFDVLLQAVARLVARVNASGSPTIAIPTQTSALLQANVHVDTRTKTRVLGDLVFAIGPVQNAKNWIDGMTLRELVTHENVAEQGFWIDGEAFEGVFRGASSPDVLWDRLPIGPPAMFLKSNGTYPEWTPLGDVGIVTASNQPRAKAYKTGPQSISDGAGTDDPILGGTRVLFDLTEFDTASFWSAGTPSRLTVPSGQQGTYLITAQASWETSATGRKAAWIYRNGARRAIAEANGDDGGLGLSFCVATMLVLNAGDYIELFVRQDTGGALFCIGSASDRSLTQLQMVKVA